MKIPAAFALLLVFGVQSEAQLQPAPPRTEPIEAELLQLEQDADKTLLTEALLVGGRKAMQQRATPSPANPMRCGSSSTRGRGSRSTRIPS